MIHAARANKAAKEQNAAGRLTPLVLFQRRWMLPTLLVLLGVALTIRLGVWQLDRLEQRREFNARVQAQLSQPELVLSGEALALDLSSMEYRAVSVSGVYDHSRQVALRNQVWENQPGVHLLTPLRIAGSDQTILVDRGWIPEGDWRRYDEPGRVQVRGVLRASQDTPDFGRRSDPIPAAGEPPLEAWFFANITAISRQLPYPLLPVYIQQAPDAGWEGLPYRTQPELDLSEGPHMGYALQWFTFAAMLGLGYPLLVRKKLRR
ncbi:MAG: SURF1 family protein [Chloroflexi bacterium]|nr:SURF1 family protein [Chloroflexota bacterium]